MYKVIVAYTKGDLESKLNEAAEMGFFLSGNHQMLQFRETDAQRAQIVYSAITINQEQSLELVQGYVGAIEGAINAD